VEATREAKPQQVDWVQAPPQLNIIATAGSKGFIYDGRWSDFK
jgi:hypothetical protein